MLNLLVVERECDRSGFEKSIAAVSLKDSVSVSYADSVSCADIVFRQNPCRYDAVFFPVISNTGKFQASADAAEKIRRINPYIQIVFMSPYNYLPLSAFECGNVRFLKKPVTVSQLERTLSDLRRTASAFRNVGGKILKLKFNREHYFVASESVIYVRKCRNGIIIVTTEGERNHSGRLDDFEKQLTGNFCRCHSSFIVNFRHAVRAGADHILMDNNQRISVSRAYRKNVESFIDGLARMDAPQICEGRGAWEREETEPAAGRRQSEAVCFSAETQKKY